MIDVKRCEKTLEDRSALSLEELKDLLRIPSISAIPEHAADVLRAASWVAARLSRAGLEGVRVLKTGGHPVVYGEWSHQAGRPTVLIYGHFDVQPVDPLELWTSPPFEPEVREGRIYARGASDDKGNLLAPILAVEALLADSKLGLNVKFLLEGQEEIGSPQIPEFVAANKELLACDIILNADGGQWSETEPELLDGLRGLCGMEIDVRGPSGDLHSGSYGGAVANPLHALAEIVASFHRPDGAVAVAGFYDEVAVLGSDERRAIASVPMDDAAYARDIGVPELFGEPGYSTNERTWIRPTLEVNGMWGGFQGQGSKTVLPSEAHAKITCRLVPQQNPARVLAAVERHVHGHVPRGVTVSVRPASAMARPFLVPAELPAGRAVERVLTAMYGRKPYRVRSGGTISICGVFLEHLGVSSVSLGFGLHDEHLHAPNEFFRLASFGRSQVAYCRVLAELASGPR